MAMTFTQGQWIFESKDGQHEQLKQKILNIFTEAGAGRLTFNSKYCIPCVEVTPEALNRIRNLPECKSATPDANTGPA